MVKFTPKKVGIAGACMIIYGVLLGIAILPLVVNYAVKMKVALKQGWFMREIWSKFPFPMYLQFYFFNVTNPDGVQKGEKPILQQIGPFAYEQWQEKVNQVDHEEDDTITFNFKNTYIFSTERSGDLTGDEEIVVPNYFILGLVNILLRERPSTIPIVGKAVDSIYKKPTTIFIKVKVRDLLFDGIPIDCSATDFAGAAVCGELKTQHKEFGMEVIGENQYLFSLWRTRNATESKEFRVLRGLKNIMDVGKVLEYDHKPNISKWDDEFCDTFNGTDGTVFHPFFDKKGRDDIVLFNSQLCRSLSAWYVGKTKVSGLSTMRYTTDLGTDPEANPRHKCYCAAPDNCMKKGAYDAFKCMGLPLVVTNPHFYNADPEFLEQVEGLNPNPELHTVAIDLDPFVGSPLVAHARAQFNMYIMKVEKFKLMKTFPNALLPLFWIDEETVLPKFLVKEIKLGHMGNALG
ncbi:hypothetical protein QAD02_023555, partial [Eretmocerus hayati]